MSVSVKEAFEKIYKNNDMVCEWIDEVESSVGCLMEIGGRNIPNDQFFYSARLLIKNENGEIERNENGFANTLFSVSIEWDSRIDKVGELYSFVELPKARRNLNGKFKTINEFMTFLDTTENLNTKTFEIVPVYKTIIDHYTIKGEIF